MKTIIKLEEAAMKAIGIYLLTIYNLGIPVWIWIFLFLAPDISMLGYMINTKARAISYNIFHHKGIAIAVASAGYFFCIMIYSLQSVFYYLRIHLLTDCLAMD